MQPILVYVFGLLAAAGGIMLITFRNPVASALSMVLSFVGLAALFITLNAYFVGIVQILVYAGAIMVLFVFIIMLLDLNDEKKVKFRSTALIAGIILPLMLTMQIIGVIQGGHRGDDAKFEKIDLEKAAHFHAPKEDQEPTAIYKSLSNEKSPKLPDTNLIGHTIFEKFNFPLQIVGVLLLVATIGVVVLSKKSEPRKTEDKA